MRGLFVSVTLFFTYVALGSSSGIRTLTTPPPAAPRGVLSHLRELNHQLEDGGDGDSLVEQFMTQSEEFEHAFSSDTIDPEVEAEIERLLLHLSNTHSEL